jgi:hypothetical protein
MNHSPILAKLSALFPDLVFPLSPMNCFCPLQGCDQDAFPLLPALWLVKGTAIITYTIQTGMECIYLIAVYHTAAQNPG